MLHPGSPSVTIAPAPTEASGTSHTARVTGAGHVLWFTGISGAGKSTLAAVVHERLSRSGVAAHVLDADEVRHGLNRDLGFSAADRSENVRRIAHVAALLADAGLVVLVACIAPFRVDRALSRELLGGRYCEVFLDTPLEVAEARDPKGLYARARRGDLPAFTGIDSPYERPQQPEMRIDTTALRPDQAADTVLAFLHDSGLVAPPAGSADGR